MLVSVHDDNGECIWNFDREHMHGMTSVAFRYDGTLQRIILALSCAINQAAFEALLVPHYSEGVSDSGTSASEVDDSVPVPAVGNANHGGKAVEVAPVIPKAAAPGFVEPEVRVVEHDEVAGMTAVEGKPLVGVEPLTGMNEIGHSDHLLMSEPLGDGGARQAGKSPPRSG